MGLVQEHFLFPLTSLQSWQTKWKRSICTNDVFQPSDDSHKFFVQSKTKILSGHNSPYQITDFHYERIFDFMEFMRKRKWLLFSNFHTRNFIAVKIYTTHFGDCLWLWYRCIFIVPHIVCSMYLGCILFMAPFVRNQEYHSCWLRLKLEPKSRSSTRSKEAAMLHT